VEANVGMSVNKVLLHVIGLDKVWTQKPLLDGKKIMELLDLQRGVPQMKEWVCIIILI
jgi:hypothetical protein